MPSLQEAESVFRYLKICNLPAKYGEVKVTSDTVALINDLGRAESSRHEADQFAENAVDNRHHVHQESD